MTHTTAERGTCGECEHPAIPIRVNGLLYAHRDQDGNGCDGSHTPPVTPQGIPTHPRTRADYINAAAAASVYFEEGRNALRAACEDGFRNGHLTLPDLAAATGRPERFIQALIQEDKL
jgi:hypothetical protein